jgi:hypothetical protein
MPGGGGGRKDISVVEDESDERRASANATAPPFATKIDAPLEIARVAD